MPLTTPFIELLQVSRRLVTHRVLTTMLTAVSGAVDHLNAVLQTRQTRPSKERTEGEECHPDDPETMCRALFHATLCLLLNGWRGSVNFLFSSRHAKHSCAPSDSSCWWCEAVTGRGWIRPPEGLQFIAMAPAFTLIVALWTMILSAPLCASGMVAHPCDPCAADCSHESNCTQDPCALKVLQDKTTHTQASLLQSDMLPLLPTWLTPVPIAFSFDEQAWRAGAFLPRTTQPYPIGLFPLLI